MEYVYDIRFADNDYASQPPLGPQHHRYIDTAGPWTMAGGVQPEDWPQWMRGFKDY